MIQNANRQRGAVMTETVLVLPLILVVLALLLFLGTSMVRLQRATTAARYATWQRAEDAPGLTTNGQVADALLGGAVASSTLDRDGDFPPRAGDLLADAADEAADDADDSGAGALPGAGAGDLTRGLLDVFPNGAGVRLSVTHEPTLPLSDRFTGPIVQRETRLGNDWRFANGWRQGLYGWQPTGPYVTPAGVIRDRVFSDFDRRLSFYADQGNPVASTVRGFYLHYPSYRGPVVPLQWVGTPWGW